MIIQTKRNGTKTKTDRVIIEKDGIKWRIIEKDDCFEITKVSELKFSETLSIEPSCTNQIKIR